MKKFIVDKKIKLEEDLYCDELILEEGGELDTNGYRIYARIQLVEEGDKIYYVKR